MSAAEDPRRHPARTAVLTGIVGNTGGGRRMFIDATGTAVPMPPAVRRLVATDGRVGRLLQRLGAEVVGCAGVLDGIEAVGESRAPDPAAVAALKPDVIVAGAVDRAHDLDAGLVEALRRIAPVIAVDTGRPAHALADLRALLGSGAETVRPRAEPSSFDAPVGPPPKRPELW
jgi:ABC-type Fe3+-hydroxamate transport system substrate-binding protein